MNNKSIEYCGLHFLHWASIDDYRCDVYRYIKNYYTIQYLSAGMANLSINGNDYKILPHTIWLSKPGDKFIYRSASENKGFSHKYFSFLGPRADGWQKAGLIFNKPLKTPQKLKCDDIIDRAMRLLRIGNPHALLQASNLLENMLLEINNKTESDISNSNRWLEELMQLLDSPDSEHISLPQLAEKVNIPLTTLRRNFRKNMGIALHEFRIKQKINKAEYLLAYSSLTINEIADRLGYRDTSFFCRQFTAHTSQTPGQFRQKQLNNLSPTEPRRNKKKYAHKTWFSGLK